MAGSEMAALKMILCYDGFYHMSGILFLRYYYVLRNLTRNKYAAQAATLIKAQYKT